MSSTTRTASERAQELAREYRTLAASILQKRGAWQVVDALQRITDPSALADSAGYATYLSLEQRLQLLETIDPEQRLDLLTGWARDQLAELDVAETIQNDVREGMERQQREFLLRQQLAAIRKELAGLDGEPSSDDVASHANTAHDDGGREIRAQHRASPRLEGVLDHVPCEVELVHDRRSPMRSCQKLADSSGPGEDDGTLHDIRIEKLQDVVQASPRSAVARRVVEEEDADLAARYAIRGDERRRGATGSGSKGRRGQGSSVPVVREGRRRDARRTHPNGPGRVRIDSRVPMATK